MFNFKLKDIKDVGLFGNDETGYNLHWFALTDSHYWITVGAEQLFRYTEQCARHWGMDATLPYVDYYLARLVEDLLEILPHVCTPIPEDIFKHVASIEQINATVSQMSHWFEEVWDESDEMYDEVYPPLLKLVSRKLDAGYLNDAPDIWIFRHDNEIIVQWDCMRSRPNLRWTATVGEYKVRFPTFVQDVVGFLSSFLTEMDEQVKRAQGYKLPENVSLDIPQLLKSHAERKQEIADQLMRLQKGTVASDTDWDQVRQALQVIQRA